jgi:exopolysaccharide biosynthesis polyprenyl glycosylphosphotransferase
MALAEQANPAFAVDPSVRDKAAASGSARHAAPRVLVAADFILIWLSALAALGVGFTSKFADSFVLPPLNPDALLTSHAGFLLLYSVLVVLLSNAQGLYDRLHTVPPAKETWAVAKAVVIAAVLQAACICLSGLVFLSRFVVGFTMLMSAVLLVGWRWLRRRRLEKGYASGLSCRNILIVGTGPQALALRAHLDRNRRLGYVVCGLVACRPEDGEAQAVDTLGSVDGLRNLVRSHFIDEVLVAATERDVVKRVLFEAGGMGLDVRVVPDLYDGLGWGAPVEYIDKFPVITLQECPRPVAGLILKRSLDLLVAAVALAALSPVFLLVAIAVRLSSPGDVIYASDRVGRRGRIFRCYKFRTMVANAEALQASLEHLNQRDRVLFKIAHDPRVTRLGRFLRKYSLDELPQLWNVLQGDMSLVGPRPPLASEVRQYELEHLRRLDALPGITGLWQVEARSNPSFARYVSLDVDYVEHWTPWLDAKILLKTIAVVLAGTGQ